MGLCRVEYKGYKFAPNLLFLISFCIFSFLEETCCMECMELQCMQVAKHFKLQYIPLKNGNIMGIGHSRHIIFSHIPLQLEKSIFSVFLIGPIYLHDLIIFSRKNITIEKLGENFSIILPSTVYFLLLAYKVLTFESF